MPRRLLLRRRSVFCRLAAVLSLSLALAWAGSAEAQQPLTRLGPQCVLPVPAPGQASEVQRHRLPSHDLQSPGAAALLALPRTATFDVSYDGFSDEARAAFAYAVAIWERHVASDVPIRVDAVWAELGDDLLGSAGPMLLSYPGNAPSGLEPDTWYPYALADAIRGEDIEAGAGNFDISATFNSEFDRWHFDTSVPAPNNRFDFATVVLHELGHGLGFIGTGTVSGQRGEIGQEGANGRYPYAYDLYVQDTAGQSLLNTAVYPNDSRPLGTVLTGDALFFDGALARSANGDNRPQLYAPDDFLTGSSYSHLDESTFPRGTAQALMTPFLSNGERIESPGSVTCGIFGDMGWPLGPACGGVIPVAPLPLFASCLFPNPSTGGRTSIALRAGDPGGPGEVRVTVYDALGRRVVEGTDRVSVGANQLCADGSARSDYNTLVQLQAPGPGLYLVRIEGEGYNEIKRWIVAR